ncbi:MAG: hypothetical protein RLZZ44_1382 [Bacteroidota bacterium]|jgi:hypothetical protein
MIIDCFPGFDEVKLAMFRLDYLAPAVDLTVIVESSLTHSGRPKELFFSEWHQSLSKFEQNKIKILHVNLENYADSWDREIATREKLVEYLKRNHPQEKFIISDLDEIPSLGQLEELKNADGIFHFLTPTFYRKLNWELTDAHKRWSRGVLGSVKYLNFVNAGRFDKNLKLLVGLPGAHLSYLGFDDEKLAKKLNSFAHVELQNVSVEAQQVMTISDKYKLDHLGRFRSQGFGLLNIIDCHENSVVESAAKTFPQFIDKDKSKPFLLKRLYMSAKLTAYYQKNLKAKTSLKEIGFKTTLFELLIGFLYAAKRQL